MSPLPNYGAWAQRISYKPNCQIRANFDYSMGLLRISVRFYGPDSAHPESNLWVEQSIMVDPPEMFEHFRYYVFDVITAMEGHERMEWFKVDGKSVKHPHR